MLVLSRKSGERLCIAGNIEVTIISVQGDRVRLGFNAPVNVPVHRAEVQQRINQERTAAFPPTAPPLLSTKGATACS